MTELLKVIEDVLEAGRKKRAKREQDKLAKENPDAETKETEEATAE